MKPFRPDSLVALPELGRFDDIIDVRTPLEFAEDHIPGAINAPVLSNEERVRVGTLYKQDSPFVATRIGAALVARNIAGHLDTLFADKPPGWKPAIYCWRGGKRSGAMTAWFRLIGWKAAQLEGGYKAWRRQVLQDLPILPGQFRYCLLGGLTGSGKTRLLQALSACGAQILDLEALASHRGSLLGHCPGQAQPGQKAFETALVQTLSTLDRSRPVFVEAESQTIGRLRLPDALMAAMRGAECVRVEAGIDDRVAFLCQDYASLFDDRDDLKARLARLLERVGRKTLEHWQEQVDHGDMAGLFRELIEQYYDPAYRRSSRTLFPRLATATTFTFRPNAEHLEPDALRLLVLLG